MIDTDMSLNHVHVPCQIGAAIRLQGASKQASRSYTLGVVPTEVKLVAAQGTLLVLGLKGVPTSDVFDCGTANKAAQFAKDILAYVDLVNTTGR